MSTSIRCIYCLVDQTGNRFKLGSTQHQHYAPALAPGYDVHESFQVGLDEQCAKIWEEGILEQYAANILPGAADEQAGSGTWMSMETLDIVRRLLQVPVPLVPIKLLELTRLESEKTQVIAEIVKIIGPIDEN